MNKIPESNKIANLRISALTCRKKDERSALPLDNRTDYPGYENK
jgi:hypothetical protein